MQEIAEEALSSRRSSSERPTDLRYLSWIIEVAHQQKRYNGGEMGRLARVNYTKFPRVG
jgi:hypothetical protein